MIAPKFDLKSVTVGAVCLLTGIAAFTPMPAVAQFGLGIPRSAGTGGATRGGLPPITILAPEDGGKTLAERPTFYWYMDPTPKEGIPSRDQVNLPNITFFLRDGNTIAAKSVFVARGKPVGAGVYKFTLPDNAPTLTEGKVQRWQVRLLDTNANQSDVVAVVRRDSDATVAKAIASAANDLEKARIYAKNAYWYDALDAYSNWLEKNPRDALARKEHAQLLEQGLANNSVFKPEKGSSFSNLLEKLAESKSAIAVTLKPR